MLSPLDGSVKILAPVAFVLAAAGTGFWLYLRSRPSASEQERRRRSAINASGRMADGFITDVQNKVVFFSYSVGGVDYTAAQELSDVPEALSSDSAVIVGPATIKYFPKNPANSIVACETWSGLRIPVRKETRK